LPRTALALPVLAPEAAAPGHLPRGFGRSAPREVHPGGRDGRRLCGLSRHPQLGDQRGAVPLLDQRPPALRIARLAARAWHATRAPYATRLFQRPARLARVRSFRHHFPVAGEERRCQPPTTSIFSVSEAARRGSAPPCRARSSAAGRRSSKRVASSAACAWT